MKKLILALGLLPTLAVAQPAPLPKPELTEFWSPVPRKVEPGAMPGQPPADAIMLFNGRDLTGWETVGGSAAQWNIENGEMVIPAKATSIQTLQKFGDCQLHVEWMVPVLLPDRKGQDRGNSGIYLQGLYEVQVLDSYDNPTYVNGQAGSIYKQSVPLVNALKRAPAWQSYDILYTAPRFYQDGSLAEPARITILLNGIVVQNNFAILGPTEYRGMPQYKAHGDGPLMLQAHNNPVHYRNLWIRKL
jgi:hypothetical protein